MAMVRHRSSLTLKPGQAVVLPRPIRCCSGRSANWRRAPYRLPTYSSYMVVVPWWGESGIWGWLKGVGHAGVPVGPHHTGEPVPK